jgi:hypothetical protein
MHSPPKFKFLPLNFLRPAKKAGAFWLSHIAAHLQLFSAVESFYGCKRAAISCPLH